MNDLLARSIFMLRGAHDDLKYAVMCEPVGDRETFAKPRHPCSTVGPMTPLFVARERFGPADGDRWFKYIEWSGLTQLQEVVTLDSRLCPSVLPEIKDNYWPHILNQDFCLEFFTNLNFLKAQLSNV